MKTRKFESCFPDFVELDELLEYRESFALKDKTEVAAKAAGTPQKDSSPSSASKRKSSADPGTPLKDAAAKRKPSADAEIKSSKAPKLIEQMV
jgi:hypothetical protein